MSKLNKNLYKYQQRNHQKTHSSDNLQTHHHHIMVQFSFKIFFLLALIFTMTNQMELKPTRISAYCPEVMPMQDWVCEMGKRPGAWNKCAAHSQCLGGMICCLNGCGIRVCQFPIFPLNQNYK